MKEKGEARRFVIRGRVQGVGFRWWTRQAAHELGLAGWVRNRPDGTVEVWAQGPTEGLRRFGRRLWEGPASARVEEVGEEEVAETPEVEGFRIRR